jgi:hypothetical protein
LDEVAVWTGGLFGFPPPQSQRKGRSSCLCKVSHAIKNTMEVKKGLHFEVEMSGFHKKQN